MSEETKETKETMLEENPEISNALKQALLDDFIWEYTHED